MPSVVQLAGMLVLVAQAGGAWAQSPPPQGRELLPRHFDFQEGESPLASDNRTVLPAENASGPGADPVAPPGHAATTAESRGNTNRSAAAPAGEIRGRGATPLAPPGPEKKKTGSDGQRSLAAPVSLLKVVGALGLVLGLFLIAAWAMRRVGPASPPLLPREVVEVLGRAPLAGRQQVHLIRLGRKLVLVSVTPAGIETLSEVTEPEEVDRLAGLCRQAVPSSATAAFREVLRQVVGTAEGRTA